MGKRGRSRAPRRTLLRRITIGPRLTIFIAAPAFVLLFLIVTLAWNDVRSLSRLESFEQEIGVVDDLLDARAAVQEERAGTFELPFEPGPTPPVLLNPTAAQVALPGGTTSAIDEFESARIVAAAGDLGAARIKYTTIIEAFDQAIKMHMSDAPGDELARRSDALFALLAADEATRLENLGLRAGTASNMAIIQLHTVADEALQRFSAGTTTEGRQVVSALRNSQPWKLANALRDTMLSGASFSDVETEWTQSFAARRTMISSLLEAEEARLSEQVSVEIDGNDQRLAWLAATVVTLIVLVGLATWAVRRSIVSPLSRISDAAQRMADGELAPVDDRATDEIAVVAHAFSSLSQTMETLWEDVDDIAVSVKAEGFDRRIDTSQLSGDWLRLATTVNETLESSQAHTKTVEAELLNRQVLADISTAAAVATSAEALTKAVLEILPNAHTSSIASLNQHPSGPPRIDLGVDLEPSISALQIPTLPNKAVWVELFDQPGIATLVEFPIGPPVVLLLRFVNETPANPKPLIGLVETAGRLLAQSHRRHLAERSARHHYEHDTLTGLNNFVWLTQWFAEQDEADEFAVIGIVPQRLDVLDATFGRDTKNKTLVAIGNRLKASLNADAVIARLDDPEFVVVAPAHAAADVAQNLLDAFAEPVAFGTQQVNVDAKIGIAPISEGLEGAIADAATVLHRGNDRTSSIKHFEEKHREDVQKREKVERWLEQAIANHELTIHFQPIVSANSPSKIEGYESLARGKDNGHPVSPAEFIPIAEQSGLIRDIGKFALREACAALPFLPGHNPYVSVNLSPHELDDPDLITNIDSILTAASVDRSRIVFEITEGSATKPEGAAMLERLTELGVGVAIDDFGSGHANLAYLTALPAKIVKLDRSLITPITQQSEALTVVESTIRMAHKIGKTIVAEGVETDEELLALRSVRCDRVQGWLTGRPAPLGEIIEIAHRGQSAEADRLQA